MGRKKVYSDEELREHRRAYEARKRIENRIKRFGTTEPQSARTQFKRLNEEDVATDFNKRYPNWIYVGGYTGCDCFITIRCKECGTEYQRSYIPIRHKQKITPCKHCEQEKRDQEEALKIISRNALRIKRTREQEAAYEKAHSYIHICPACGKEFKGTKKRVTCSPECGRKWSNIKASHRHDKRFGHSRRITWQDVRKRTGSMTCALCGGQCDESDFVFYPDGTKVCGKNYPSVDHIIPPKLGGTDTFDNVQLAHCGCNTIKSDNSIVMFLDDQVAFNL